MGYIVSAGLLLMGIWCHRNQRTWACPEALFCYEWALISFLASLRLFGLYEASWYTWIVILIGSISFIIGCLVGQMFKVKTYGIVEDSSVDRNIISERAFWIFAAVIIIYTSSDLFQSIHYRLDLIELDKLKTLIQILHLRCFQNLKVQNNH